MVTGEGRGNEYDSRVAAQPQVVLAKKIMSSEIYDLITKDPGEDLGLDSLRAAHGVLQHERNHNLPLLREGQVGYTVGPVRTKENYMPQSFGIRPYAEDYSLEFRKSGNRFGGQNPIGLIVMRYNDPIAWFTGAFDRGDIRAEYQKVLPNRDGPTSPLHKVIGGLLALRYAGPAPLIELASAEKDEIERKERYTLRSMEREGGER